MFCVSVADWEGVEGTGNMALGGKCLDCVFLCVVCTDTGVCTLVWAFIGVWLLNADVSDQVGLGPTQMWQPWQMGATRLEARGHSVGSPHKMPLCPAARPAWLPFKGVPNVSPPNFISWSCRCLLIPFGIKLLVS